ncbi:MAG: aminoglycoside phosphotransferase family protein [Chloroflexota bacterium]
MDKQKELHQTLITAGYLHSDDTISLKRLQGGYHNHVFRLQNQTTEHDWVVKQFLVGSDNPMFPTLPDDEAAALKMFSGTGLAPDFVGYLPDVSEGAILLYRFVPGSMWDGDLVAAAQLLYQTHHTPVVGNFRQLPITSDAILGHAKKIFDLMNNPEPFLEPLRPYFFKRHVDPAPISPYLIHTDCGPGNMITGPEGTCLIDWQCPGIGDPVEDLTIFVSPAIQILYARDPLTLAERDLFLESYGDPTILARFERLNLFYRLRFMAYSAYRIESLAETDPEISQRYQTAFDAELAYIREQNL